ncbi:hypothetical protein AB0B28_15950 [Glycomyces sp. NPDC046736]|uniref:hypothetical protein n=1 Tax=Glycomyces sp. NPDC046736 TaxID=3155615 RepID=UPI0033FBCBF9
MTPEQRQREHLTYLITGDLTAAADLREQFADHSRTSAAEHVRAAAAVCLEFRFGPGAGRGAGAIDRDELAAFMSEIRQSNHDIKPSLDLLAVEAAVRSLYGEPHLVESPGIDVFGDAFASAFYTALRHQVRAHPWLAANPGYVVDRARQLMMFWLLG